MKKSPVRFEIRAAMWLLTGVLLTSFANAALAAGGLNLSWNDCGAAGVLEKDFACTTNATTIGTIFASVVPGVAITGTNGQNSILDVQTTPATLSPWWHFETGGCRGASGLTFSADFSTGPFTCIDTWSSTSFGGYSYNAGFGGANRARILVGSAIVVDVPLTATDEYYLFKLLLRGAASTGAGSCTGCTDGACIVLTSVTLTRASGATGVTYTNPLTRSHVIYQPGGNSLGCPGATPARGSSWGGIKSLYR